jgi:hypothetical protein
MKTGKRRQEDIRQADSRAVRVSEVFAPTGELLLYKTQDGKARIECRFAEETLWMSQAQMAELFQTTPQNITLHLKALDEEGEINKVATSKDFLQVRTEGKRSKNTACDTAQKDFHRLKLHTGIGEGYQRAVPQLVHVRQSPRRSDWN